MVKKYEDMTIPELEQEALKAKAEKVAAKEKQKAINAAIALRQAKDRAEAKVKAMSPTEKKAMAEALS